MPTTIPAITFDAISLSRDPDLATMPVPAISPSREHPQVTPKIIELMMSRAAKAALVGVAVGAPSKVVVTAVEPMLEALIGDDAFTDYHKQVIGRLAKMVLCHLGAVHTRPGVPVTVTSRFSSGSTYAFPAYQRRPMKRDSLTDQASRLKKLIEA